MSKLDHQESVRHHYAPIFYLKNWCNSDGQVHVVRNVRGRIVRGANAPKYIGFENHLYSYSEDFQATDRAELETKFFQPLDTDGARIIRSITANEDLSERDKHLWAMFLLAMRIRTPEIVAKVRTDAANALLKEMSDGQKEYEALRAPHHPPTAIEWLAVAKPGLVDSIGITLIPKIVSNPQALKDISSMSWWAVTFRDERPLLSSDRPCIYTSGLADPECVVALPLSPSSAFFAVQRNSNARHRLQGAAPKVLVASLNESVVIQAKARAFAQSQSDVPDSFFLKRLSQTSN